MPVCVYSVYFRTKPQPTAELVTVPANCVSSGLWAIPSYPFDQVWPPTTSGDLRSIFSTIDSQHPPPLRLKPSVVCMWVCMVECVVYWYSFK